MMFAPVISTFPTTSLAGLDLMVILAIKATLVLACAGVLVLALRGAAAATRHLVWSAALIGVLALPVMAVWGPGFSVRGWALPKAKASELRLADASAEGSVVEEPASPATPAEPIVTEPSTLAPAPAEEVHAAASARPLEWTTWVLLVWAAGATVLGLWLVLGVVILARLTRGASRVTEPDTIAVFESCRDELGLHRPIELWISERAPVPCTWGLVRPRVMIPGDAASWPAERLRVVLLHELAHVSRRDCLLQLVAQVACALYWFQPLVWVAARRMRIERERACDDRVLACETEAGEYAEHLLAVVRAMRGHGFSATGAVAFARPSQFEGRLLAVLDSRRSRGVLTARWAWRAAALAALVVLPLAVLRPWTGSAGADITLISGKHPRPEDAPASEVRHAPSTTKGLTAKLEWATAQGSRSGGGYWVGYVIPDVGHNDGMLSDSAPLDLESLDPRWKGARVADVLAGKTLRDPNVVPERGVIVISYHYPARGARPEDIDRIRVQSMKLAADYRREPLYWLGAIDDRESFDWARRVQTATRDHEVRETALDAVAFHGDAEAVRRYLSGILRSQEPNEMRAAAAEHLSRFDDPSTLALLEKTIREDRSSEVRESAIEALGHMHSSESVRLLSRLARDKSQSASVRREAVEALGDKASEDAVVALEALAGSGAAPKAETDAAKRKPSKVGVSQDGDVVTVYDKQGRPAVTIQGTDENQTIQVHSGDERPKSTAEEEEEEVQRQAVEALGNLPPEKALPKLLKIARTHPNHSVRREAIETIGGLETQEAYEALVALVWDQKDGELAWAAVEALEDYDQGASKLIDIARRHPNDEVRGKAVETLGNVARPDALAALEDIVRNDRNEDIQCRAVEAMAEYPEAQSLPRLEKIARTHPRVSVRRRAIEGIGEIGDPEKAAQILESLIGSGTKKGS